jgi:hypothetical protein
MVQDYNGIWVSAEGNVFTIAAPYTIWGTVGDQHLAAYDIKATDDGSFAADWEGSKFLISEVPQYPYQNQEPQLYVQEQLAVYGPNPISFPPQPHDTGERIACVLPPVRSDSADYGTLTIRGGAEAESLLLTWTSQKKNNVFNGLVYYAGRSEKVSIAGKYVSKDVQMEIFEAGERSRRKLSGTITVSGTAYEFKGFRIWGRGGFYITSPDKHETIGTGWVEWEPTPEFARGLKASGGEAADRIQIGVTMETGLFSKGRMMYLYRP